VPVSTMKMLATLCLCAYFFAAYGPPSAAAQERVALVIGMDRYPQLPADKQLRKAGNDARAIAQGLSDVGFKVRLGENVGRREFNRLWARFINRLSPGDVAAFFFSGHGVELSGENFLIPSDIPRLSGNDETLLRGEAISMQRLLADLRDKRPRMSLLIIDACRDNPFSDGLGRSLGGTRGLARVTPPSGTFMMYSAGAGQKALDRLSNSDSDPNSVYTRSLLPLIKQQGLSIQDVAIRVRRKVHKLAKRIGHRQRPAYYDEVLGTFYLAGETDGRRDVPADEILEDDRNYSPFPGNEYDIERTERQEQEEEAIRQRISAFVKWDHLQMGTTTPSVKRENFAERLHYYGRSNVSRDEVISDKRRYYEKWPTTKYSLIEPTLKVWRSGNPNEYGVEFEYEFVVKNASEERSGRGLAYLTLKVDNQYIRVVREDGQVLEVKTTARRR